MRLTATEPPRTILSSREKKREFLFWLSFCFGMGATILYRYIETHSGAVPDGRILIALGIVLQLGKMLRAFMKNRKHPRNILTDSIIKIASAPSTAFWLGALVDYIVPHSSRYTVLGIAIGSAASLLPFASRPSEPYQLILEQGFLSYGNDHIMQWRTKAADIVDVRSDCLKYFDGQRGILTIEMKDGDSFCLPSSGFSVSEVRKLLGLPFDSNADTGQAASA